MPLLAKFPSYSPDDIFDRVDHSTYLTAGCNCSGSTFRSLDSYIGYLASSSMSTFRTGAICAVTRSIWTEDLVDEWVRQSYRE